MTTNPDEPTKDAEPTVTEKEASTVGEEDKLDPVKEEKPAETACTDATKCWGDW